MRRIAIVSEALTAAFKTKFNH